MKGGNKFITEVERVDYSTGEVITKEFNKKDWDEVEHLITYIKKDKYVLKLITKLYLKSKQLKFELK